jgi:serine/threonine protein kinase
MKPREFLMVENDLDDFCTPPDLDGELLRYDILRRLGQGGFGITWLALDKNLQRNAAIKNATVSTHN